jgi:peptide/nickel transport system substrate-binding protein
MALHLRIWVTVAFFLSLASGLAACGTSAASLSAESLNVLELGTTYGSWSSLDPLTDAAPSVNHDFFNAVYGELFEQGPGGALIPDLASGYKVTDNGLEVDIFLRAGVKFSDGTPLDAGAVAFNLHRDLTPSSACECLQNFVAVSSVGVLGDKEVILHLRRLDPAIIYAFIDEAPNWILSPVSLLKLGEPTFALKPVGAGPFTVVSDVLGSQLALQANPTYWQKGYPKLKTLTFMSVANDTSAYEAMTAGQAQVYMDFGTPALLPEMRKRFDVIATPATQTEAVNLNSSKPPFTNILAREALYDATNAPAINQHIFQGAGLVSQAPGGPGDLFWQPTVPAYRTYDLTKAKALVKQLGGLTFTLTTISTPLQKPVAEALQSEWEEAGIRASISVVTIPQALQETEDGSLQAVATQVGSYDPSLVPGIAASYSSDGPFSLIKDAALDRLIDAASAEPSRVTTGKIYRQIFSYLNQKAYAPYLFTTNLWNVTDRSVTGVANDAADVSWQNVGTTS